MTKFNEIPIPNFWNRNWSEYPNGYTETEMLMHIISHVNSLTQYLNNFKGNITEEQVKQIVRDSMANTGGMDETAIRDFVMNTLATPSEDDYLVKGSQFMSYTESMMTTFDVTTTGHQMRLDEHEIDIRELKNSPITEEFLKQLIETDVTKRYYDGVNENGLVQYWMYNEALEQLEQTEVKLFEVEAKLNTLLEARTKVHIHFHQTSGINSMPIRTKVTDVESIKTVESIVDPEGNIHTGKTTTELSFAGSHDVFQNYFKYTINYTDGTKDEVIFKEDFAILRHIEPLTKIYYAQ